MDQPLGLVALEQLLGKPRQQEQHRNRWCNQQQRCSRCHKRFRKEQHRQLRKAKHRWLRSKLEPGSSCSYGSSSCEQTDRQTDRNASSSSSKEPNCSKQQEQHKLAHKQQHNRCCKEQHRLVRKQQHNRCHCRYRKQRHNLDHKPKCSCWCSYGISSCGNRTDPSGRRTDHASGMS